VLLGCLFDFKYFLHPKILGHVAMSWFISPFLKIYGDGPMISKFKLSGLNDAETSATLI